MSSCYTRCEQLSARTFLVVEQDRFGQFPFMYVIMGDDKCILIDSGCGTGDYRDFVTTRINKSRLPYLVISTHVHFDHIGANHRFCGANREGILITSLAFTLPLSLLFFISLLHFLFYCFLRCSPLICVQVVLMYAWAARTRPSHKTMKSTLFLWLTPTKSR